MGLLDTIGSIAGQMGNAGAGSSKAALIQAVLGMIAHGNEPGGLGGAGGLGGLTGLLQRFQNAGLGDQVASWIGTGSGPLQSLAEHAGIDEDEAATHLSSLLPQLVDRLTPQGQVSDAPIHQDAIGDVMATFNNLFGAKP
jgi:uncharacterized protein YidB (DUF937 family)